METIPLHGSEMSSVVQSIVVNSQTAKSMVPVNLHSSQKSQQKLGSFCYQAFVKSTLRIAQRP